MKSQRHEIGAGQKVQSPDLVVLLEVEIALGLHQENVNLRIVQLDMGLDVHDREANLTVAIQELNVRNDHDHRIGVKHCRNHVPRAEAVAENNIGRLYVLLEADFSE